MEYVVAGEQDIISIFDLVQQTIQSIYPKYYPAEVVGFFRKLSGNPRLFNCRDESAKRFFGEFEKSKQIPNICSISSCFFFTYMVYYVYER